jgi:mono/diheme cytochrome c family protein
VNVLSASRRSVGARAATGVVAGLLLALAVSQAACSSDKTSSTPVVPEGGDAGKGLPPASSADLVPDDGSPGAKAINTRRCGACHNDPGQPAMSGKSTMLPNYPAGIELYGPNLTSDMELGVGKWTDGQLRLAIREGVDDESLSLCPQMQHYKTMSDEEVDNIIKYLRSLPPAHRVAPRSICPPLKTK